MAELPSISAFKGFNNVSDPLRLGLGWLVSATNINITDSGAIEQRKGYSRLFTGSFTGAYATLDAQRLYLIDAGVLKAMAATPVTLAALTSTDPMFWCEVNENVYFNNGTDSGIIQPDNEVLPWRASTLADTQFLSADGTALSNLLDPLPLGTDVIQHWKGRIYASQPMISDGQSVVWFSEPLGYHLWKLDTSFFTVPGIVRAMAPTKDALIVGTDERIYAYSSEGITQLANYGVVAGDSWDRDGERILMWTTRGLCIALPFENLTERQASVAPGVRVAARVIREGGQRRFVAALQQGKEAFNAYP